jgi:hypothetical protein
MRQPKNFPDLIIYIIKAIIFLVILTALLPMLGKLFGWWTTVRPPIPTKP